jgi:hypothetical protein
LVEASAAEAEAINNALKAAEAKAAASRETEEAETGAPDRDRGAEATPRGKSLASPAATLMGLNKLPDGARTPPPTDVRLHHRAVRFPNIFHLHSISRKILKSV